MPIIKRTETNVGNGTILVESRYDGGMVEIGVYRGSAAGKDLVAVVTRPMPGAKWFAHTDRSRSMMGRNKAAVIGHAVEYAERR